MMKVISRLGVAALAILTQVGVAGAAQNTLFNGSMEAGPGAGGLDPMVPAVWILDGNVVERSAEANLVPAGAGHALKAFQSNPQETAYQEIPVTGGVDMVSVSAQLFTRASDKLGGDALAAIALTFFNDAGVDQGSAGFDFAMDASSPAETWIPASVGPILAPAGATKARMSCFWLSSTGSGSAYWDDAQLTIGGGGNLLSNGDFEQAGVGGQTPTGIDDWVGFNDQEQSTDQALDGTKSVKVGTTEAFNGLVQNMAEAAEGDRILLKARVFNSSTNGLTGDARAGIKLEFAAPGGGVLPPPTESFQFDANSDTNAWVFVDIGTIGVVVPENAGIARVVMIVAPDVASTTGFAYFDQAFAALSRAPSTNLLLNPSFEDGFGGPPTHWVDFGAAGQSIFEVPGLEDDLVTEDIFAASVKASAGGFSGVSQDISMPSPLQPDEMLYVRVFVRQRKDTKLLGTARAGVKIEWFAGTIPGNVDITPGPSANTITSASPTDTWIELEIDYTMPAGTAAVTKFVCLTGKGTTGAGAAYFDNCEAIVLNRFDGSDSDGDGDEDLADYAAFQRCLPGGSLPWNCTVFDDDDSLDIDLADFDFFLSKFTGP